MFVVKSVYVTVAKKNDINVHTHTNSKQIELVLVAQDLKTFQFPSKPEQPGLSSSIRSEVMMERT